MTSEPSLRSPAVPAGIPSSSAPLNHMFPLASISLNLVAIHPKNPLTPALTAHPTAGH